MLNSNYKVEWGRIPSVSNDELKKIAKDLYSNLIFSDRHCNDSDITAVFMALLFIGPQEPDVPEPKKSDDIVENRDRISTYLIEEDTLKLKYKKEMKLYKKALVYYRDKFLPSIGFIYEYLSESSNVSVNGLPTFLGIRFLNIEDTKKMISYYKSYKAKREEVDNF